MGGAVAGSVAGPGGTILGSGAGMALGGEVFERIAKQYGAEVLRTNKEHAAQKNDRLCFWFCWTSSSSFNFLKGFKGSFSRFR